MVRYIVLSLVIQGCMTYAQEATPAPTATPEVTPAAVEATPAATPTVEAAPAATPAAPAPEAPAAPTEAAPASAPAAPAATEAPAASTEAAPATTPTPAAMPTEAPATPAATPASADAAAQAAAPAASADSTVAAEPTEKQGIDTINLQDPAGNWLFKRVHWENGKKKYEQIKEATRKIAEARMAFFAQRYKLDNEVLREFYFNIGLNHGDLQSIVNELLADLKKEQERQGNLTADEREVMAKTQEKQALLEDLKNSIKRIKDLDRQLNEALTLLMDQMNIAQKYEDEAWQHFNSIAMELSDKTAKKLFYKMDALWQNTQGILAFIQQGFSTHFNKVVNQIQDDVKRVEKSTTELKEAGINLRQEFERAEQKEKELEDAAAAQQKAVKEEALKRAAQEKEEAEGEGWFSVITNPIVGFFGIIWHVIKMPYVWIFGEADEAEKVLQAATTEKPAQAAVPSKTMIDQLVKQPAAKTAAPQPGSGAAPAQ